MNTFTEIELEQEDKILQYQSYPLFNQRGDPNGFNPFAMIPNPNRKGFEIIGLEEYFHLICMFAANGDYFLEKELYEKEDYGDVFHSYVINACRGK